MSGEERSSAAVKTKSFLIDAESMTVVWMNEAAEESVPAPAAESALTVELIAPVTGANGVADAVGEVARSGEARHLRASLVSTGKGGLDIVSSVYRLPDGRVLLLSEVAWQVPKPSADDTSPRGRRPARRTR